MGPKPTACGNPLWAEWIEDVAEECRASGSKSERAYAKAAKALRSCPLRFEHPEQAIELAGVGPAVVALITKKLQNHCDQTGQQMPQRILGGGASSSRAPASTATSTATRKRKSRPASDDEAEVDARKEARIIQSQNGGFPVDRKLLVRSKDIPGQPAKLAKAPRAIKEYVPKERSGPYAVLVGLYTNAPAEEKGQWALKAETIRLAQPWSNTPMDKPTVMAGGGAQSTSTGWHTGWSGTKILIDKGLLIKDNKSPAHYSLSEAGWALADKLARASNGKITVHDPSPAAGLPRRSAGLTPPGPGPTTTTTMFRSALGVPLFLSDDEDDDMGITCTVNGSAGRAGQGPSQAGRHAAADAALHRSLGTGPASSPSAGVHPSSEGLLHRSSSAYYGTSVCARAPPSGSGLGPDSPFDFFYLDEADQRVTLRDQAEVGQDEDDGFAPIYRIEYRLAQDLHAMARGLKRKATFKSGREGTKQAFIRDRQATRVCPGFARVSLGKGSGERSAVESMAALMSMGGHKDKERRADPRAMYDGMAEQVTIRGADESSPVGPSPGLRKRPTETNTASPNISQPTLPGLPSKLAPPGLGAPPLVSAAAPLRTSASMLAWPAAAPPGSSGPKETAIASFDSFDAASPPGTVQLVVNRHPLDPVRDHIPPAGFVPPTFAPVVWPAGSYSICLAIDMREQAGLRSNKNEIVGALKVLDRGMEVEERMLPVGDMVWVAKKKASHGGRAGVDEAVLDCVVERKRLDDLCGSIRDGRYLTQKARLKDSAITDRVYLIEKYETERFYESYGKQIWTVKSQLQLHDGFHVYEATNLADVCNYLHNKTRVLKQLHEHRPLHILPDALIDRPTYLALQRHLRATQPTRPFLTSYEAYHALNSAEANATVRSQWGAMVLRIKGVSAEKATQFIQRWPTPGSFWQSVEHERRSGGGGTAKEAGEWVGSECGGSVRALKGVVGARVWELFAARGRYSQ